jgi:hypothetical protein
LGLSAYVLLHEIDVPFQEGAEQIFPGLQAQAITQLTIEHSGFAPLELHRIPESENWMITAPVRDQADSVELHRLLEAITHLPANTLNGIEESDSHGLASPRTRIRFRTKDNEKTISLGSAGPLNQITYVRVDPGKTLLAIPSEESEILSPTLHSLRDRSLVRFPIHLVRTIRVKAGALSPSGQDASYTLKRGDRKSAWLFSSPIADPADPKSVRQLLNGLRNLQAQKFAEGAPPDLALHGLTPPKWRIVLELEEGYRVGPIEIGRPSGPQNKTHVRIEGRDAILQIDSKIFSQIEQPQELRSRDLIHRFPSPLARVIFSRPDGSHWTLLRVKSGWTILDQKPDGTHLRESADKRSVQKLIDRIRNARIESIEADGVGSPPPARYGLTPARVTVQLLAPDHTEGLTVIYIGSPTKSSPDKTYVQLSERPGSVFTIDTELANHLVGTQRPEWLPLSSR